MFEVFHNKILKSKLKEEEEINRDLFQIKKYLEFET
ncbi:hypothetical protein P1062_0203545 [Pasteurella multocida subsp. multocida P1062]|nr:hypothetical protein P1062_0203545 [Pasteurella multocida subsp. multocida P1062]